MSTYSPLRSYWKEVAKHDRQLFDGGHSKAGDWWLDCRYESWKSSQEGRATVWRGYRSLGGFAAVMSMLVVADMEESSVASEYEVDGYIYVVDFPFRGSPLRWPGLPSYVNLRSPDTSSTDVQAGWGDGGWMDRSIQFQKDMGFTAPTEQNYADMLAELKRGATYEYRLPPAP